MPNPFDPSAWAALVTACADAFGKVVKTFSEHFASAMVTTVLLCGLWIGYEAIQRGSLVDAIHVLITTRAERLHEAVNARAARMQAELRAVTAADREIQSVLDGVLLGPGGGTHLRFAALHNGSSTITNTSLLQFDVVNSAATRGRARGEMVTNQPISAWASYLPTLIDNKCKMMRTDRLTDAGAIQRMTDLGIVQFLACPVNETRGMVGALFYSWDTEADIPSDATDLTRRLEQAAAKIGVAYSLRPKEETGH